MKQQMRGHALIGEDAKETLAKAQGTSSKQTRQSLGRGEGRRSVITSHWQDQFETVAGAPAYPKPQTLNMQNRSHQVHCLHRMESLLRVCAR
jgi:hypothetical protein